MQSAGNESSPERWDRLSSRQRFIISYHLHGRLLRRTHKPKLCFQPGWKWQHERNVVCFLFKPRAAFYTPQWQKIAKDKYAECQHCQEKFPATFLTEWDTIQKKSGNWVKNWPKIAIQMLIHPYRLTLRLPVFLTCRVVVGSATTENPHNSLS